VAVRSSSERDSSYYSIEESPPRLSAAGNRRVLHKTLDLSSSLALVYLFKHPLLLTGRSERATTSKEPSRLQYTCCVPHTRCDPHWGPKVATIHSFDSSLEFRVCFEAPPIHQRRIDVRVPFGRIGSSWHENHTKRPVLIR